MCGIAGCFGIGKARPDEKTVAAVFDAIRERGPDACGRWSDPDASLLLLHRRLSIRDLSDTGAQPMFSTGGRYAIVFNGEIYNADDLRARVPEYRFVGTSDTECILALYEAYGAEMLPLLRGMYAFAIWDTVEKSLFLARDPYGIKPLYVTRTQDGIWFASQVKALLPVPGVDLSPSPAGHAGFFLWGSVPEPYSLYRGIHSLRAGHAMWLKAGSEQVRVTQFASLAQSFAAGAEQAEAATQNAIQDAIREALHESVRMHFISDVPVAVFLSAGLDSSTILGIASDTLPAEQLHALTLGFDVYAHTANSETEEAALIARHYGIPHRVHEVSQADFAAAADSFLQSMDQPTIDAINTYFVAKMAREAGFKVALSGVGGDELFGGYNSFQQIPRLLGWSSRLPVPHGLGVLFRKMSEPFFARLTSPKYAGVLEYSRSIQDVYLLRRGLYMPWELPEVLDTDLALAGLAELGEDEYERKEFALVKGCSLHAQVAYLESTRYLRNQLLRDSDWAGMAHSVEIRTPLVDFSLLQRLAGLLASAHPPGKQRMAATPAVALPRQILERKKTGFTVPIRDWLVASQPEKPERGLRSWAKFVYQSQWR